MSRNRISVLHISDLHVPDDVDGARRWDRRRVLGAKWQENLDEILKRGPLDLLCFTGDIAFSGRERQYEHATTFLRDLSARLSVPLERFFLVPGNHDVDRDVEPDAWRTLRELKEHERPVLSRWMADDAEPDVLHGRSGALRDAILERQRAYRTWIGDVLGRNDLLPGPGKAHPRLGYRVEVPGLGAPFPVHLIGLDSAWLCGQSKEHRQDAHNVFLTRDQVGRLTSGLHGLRIALVHHPLEDMGDGAECRRLLTENVDMLLRGHLHDTELELRKTVDRDSLWEVAAGCLYESGTYPNACHRLDIDCDDTGRVVRLEVLFRAWSAKGHWHNATGVYAAASRDGVFVWDAAHP